MDRVFTVAIALPLLFLCGCSARYVQGSGSSPSPGTAVIIDGGLAATVRLGAGVSTAIAGAAIVGIVAAGNDIDLDSPPRMKEDRTINEQDCKQPIVDLRANLKCK